MCRKRKFCRFSKTAWSIGEKRNYLACFNSLGRWGKALNLETLTFGYYKEEQVFHKIEN